MKKKPINIGAQFGLHVESKNVIRKYRRGKILGRLYEHGAHWCCVIETNDRTYKGIGHNREHALKNGLRKANLIEELQNRRSQLIALKALVKVQRKEFDYHNDGFDQEEISKSRERLIQLEQQLYDLRYQ